MNNFTLPYRSELKTAGYKATFTFLRLDVDELLAEVTVMTEIALAIHADLADIELARADCVLLASDLRNLRGYFETHVKNLQDDPTSIAPIFVNPDLDFQLQALIGDIWTENDRFMGGFSLRFALNGGSGSDKTNVYVGAEAQTSVGDIRTFLRSLDAFVEHIAPV